jgi:hypothetical protein
MDDLVLDPCGDRVMKNVPMIAWAPLKSSDLWKKNSKYKHTAICYRARACPKNVEKNKIEDIVS